MRTAARSTARRTRKPRPSPHRRGRRLAHAVHPDYLALVREHPLRPIHDDADYDAAAAMLDRLAVKPEESLTPGERDYLDTLTLLVEAYDAVHYKVPKRAMSGLEALKYVMAESGMTQGQLGELLGNRALASLILNGHRSLSKTHIRMLAEHFRVEPGLFLGEDR